MWWLSCSRWTHLSKSYSVRLLKSHLLASIKINPKNISYSVTPCSHIEHLKTPTLQVWTSGGRVSYRIQKLSDDTICWSKPITSTQKHQSIRGNEEQFSFFEWTTAPPSGKLRKLSFEQSDIEANEQLWMQQVPGQSSYASTHHWWWDVLMCL